MKNSLIKFMLLFIMIGCLFSCNDDSLTEINPNNRSTGIFWKNLTDTNSGLAATYNGLLDEHVYSIFSEALRDDMGWPGFGRPITSNVGIRNLYELNFTNSSGFVENKWTDSYTVIYRANQVIKALNDIDTEAFSDQEMQLWTNQMAESRFIRGLVHFYLHSDYNNGSIIIRKDVPITPEDFNIPLSSSEEVIAFFREDLKYAYENLPVRYESNDDLGRATKGAAATILGTSYLYQKDYPGAMVYFNDIINNVTADYGYKLVEDTSLLFTTAGEFNQESIFELNYSLDYRTEIGNFKPNILTNPLANQTTKNFAAFMPAWLINAYKNDFMDPLDDRNYYDDPDAPSGRSFRPVSLRTSSMAAIADDDVSIYYGETTGSKVKLGNNGWGFGYYKKYTNHDIQTVEGEDDPRGNRSSGKNIAVNRLADVYLMQAECFIKTGDVDGALELINAVRYRWALVLLGLENPKWAGSSFDLIAYDAESLMDHLMYIEKPLELSIEGHQIRWNDLRRWGVIGENFTNLAASTFYASTITVKQIDGTTITVKTSISEDPGTAAGLDVIDYEYVEKALNYNPAIHDYFPIPLSEIIKNPNVN